MTKSLVLSWISNCDYPLYRAWLEKYHSFFDEILIYWDTNFRFPFFQAFIQQSLSHLPNIKFLDKVEGEDWRHTATTELIKHATGDWICSIEQDWFARNWPELFEYINKGLNISDLFGWLNPTNQPYVHPAFFFIKRELLEKTSKDFSAHPEINGSDHFAQITYDVKRVGGTIGELPNVEFSPDALAFHLGGVNQNYLNGLSEGFEFHRPEVFFIYNYQCRQINIVQSPKFLGLSQDIEYKLLEKNMEINLRNNEWNKFFI